MSEQGDVLAAPCKWCGYNGHDYWQTRTHNKACRWYAVGGEAERRHQLTQWAGKLPQAASAGVSPDLKAVDALYLSDLAADHAAQVAAGSETVEYALRTVAVLGYERALREAQSPPPASNRSQPIEKAEADRSQPMRRDLARLLDSLYGLHVRPGHLDAVLEVVNLHAPVKAPIAPPASGGVSREKLEALIAEFRTSEMVAGQAYLDTGDACSDCKAEAYERAASKLAALLTAQTPEQETK